ncbi:MAG: ferrous iron transport protein A [Thermogutta sp.]|nr:ferrous iron transport protein A [Thermogutta sp.]
MIRCIQPLPDLQGTEPAIDRTAAEPLPLNLLRAGDRGIIVGLQASGDAAHRLQEIGLCRGREIRVFRPGNPCIVQVGGSKFCLRADHVRILVEPIDQATVGAGGARHRHRRRHRGGRGD